VSAHRRPKGPAPSRAAQAPVGPPVGEVAIRMYNVGFGDAFLLTFPADDRPRRVLIDCGSHAAGPPPAGMEAVVAQIIADVTEGGTPHIDVVVATHRHRDHVLGFASGSWAGVRVGQVWMPWTEDPLDPVARRIRETQGRRGLQLQAALAATHLDAAVRERARDIVENSLPNAEAMATLHGGFAGSPRRRYLPERKGHEGAFHHSFRPKLLPGVSVHVLGPSRDREVIRDMNPPPDESYLRAAAGGGKGERRTPFASQWALSPAGADFRPWLREQAQRDTRTAPDAPLRPEDPSFVTRYVQSLGLKESQVRAIDHASQDDPFAAAVALDQAVNGTSLMLVFEVGRARLLFPGDAQWGTWKAALADARTRELLAGSSFYKVGHHGSHNATPLEFVEKVLQGPLLAMVSTCATKRFTKIPRLPLLKALGAKASGILRSDDAVVKAPFRRVGPNCVECRVGI